MQSPSVWRIQEIRFRWIAQPNRSSLVRTAVTVSAEHLPWRRGPTAPRVDRIGQLADATSRTSWAAAQLDSPDPHPPSFGIGRPRIVATHFADGPTLTVPPTPHRGCIDRAAQFALPPRSTPRRFGGKGKFAQSEALFIVDPKHPGEPKCYPTSLQLTRAGSPV